MIGIETLELALQPPFATVTLTATLPEAPAVKVMAFVPAPLVIEPLVTLQLYVAPLCAVTLALADVEAQTDDGAVVVADGAALIGIVAFELLAQPLGAVTVIESATLPVDPGVKVMAFVPAPPVMLPLLIDQLYDAPAVAVTLALPVDVAQIEAGAVMADAGAGLIVTFALPLAEQLVASVTVTPRVRVPDAPGVKVIALVPWPLVITPFVIVQL